MTPPAIAPLLVDFFEIVDNADPEGSGVPECSLLLVVRRRWLNENRRDRDRTGSADAAPIART